jgi:hypothetical protein
MNCCTTERFCQLQFINGYAPVLHNDAGDTLHRWRRADSWRAAWTGSLRDSFMPTVETFHSSKRCSMTWGSVCTHGCRPTHLSSTRTMWSIFVHDSHLPLSATTHHWLTNFPLKRNLRHPVLPSIGRMFNYPWPVNTCNFWMARYLRSHVTTRSVNHLWTAFVICHANMKCLCL